jgi:hypothetical protein
LVFRALDGGEMGSVTGCDNRADAEETVRHERAIAHDCVNSARVAALARRRHASMRRLNRRVFRMMLIIARSGAVRTGCFAGARSDCGLPG